MMKMRKKRVIDRKPDQEQGWEGAKVDRRRLSIEGAKERSRLGRLGQVKFVTNYWEIFKEDLGKWNQEEIVNIIRVYNLLEQYVYSDFPPYHVQDQLLNLMSDKLKWFEKKIETDVTFAKRIDEVNKEFINMQKITNTETDHEYAPKYFPMTKENKN